MTEFLIPKRFVLVAGEASGDQIGAPLIEALKQAHPGAEFVGIGGPAMTAAGLKAWWDCSELAVMGLAEVLKHLPRLLRLRRELVSRCLEFEPDCFIGIDAPDFNLGVERRLKQRGVKTVHYVSPSIWAWRQKRAAKIGRSADLVLCLFPFEPALYERFEVNATFVGHPLADVLPLAPDQDAARAITGLPGDKRFVAVLPGSRVSEVQRLGPVFADAVRLIKQRRPEVEFVSPAATAQTMSLFVEQLNAAQTGTKAYVCQGLSREAMVASDVVMLASGTAALEAMLAKKPMVVGYKVAGLTYAIVKLFRMLKVDQFSLPNALANEALVPEHMQQGFTAEAMASDVLRLLDDTDQRLHLKDRFAAIHQTLRGDGAGRAASAVTGLLEQRA